jgi:hypothetical protein
MSRRAFLPGALALPLVAAALATDPAGRWSGTMTTPDAQYPVVYDLRPNGSELSGSLEFVGLAELPFSGGTVKGDSVYFTVDAVQVLLQHRGLVVGDSLRLAVDAGTGELPLVLARVRAAP